MAGVNLNNIADMVSAEATNYQSEISNLESVANSDSFDMSTAADSTAKIQVAQATLEYAQSIVKNASDFIKGQGKKLQQG